MVALPTFLAGELPDGDKFTALLDYIRAISRTAVKGSSDSIANDAVADEDSELTLTVDANTRYTIIANIIYEAATANDIKFGFNFPTGATMPWGQMALDTAATTFFGDIRPTAYDAPASGATFNAGGAGAGNQLLALLVGTLTVAGTAGSITVVRAQASSGATATIVKAGSTLEARLIS